DEIPVALGSDTGGSIRVPSALCGTIGLKPTYGRVSLFGAWPLARTLDHPGPMARTPADAALLLEAIAGVDIADPSSEDTPLGDVRGELRRGLSGLRVGICPDLDLVSLSPSVRGVFGAALQTVEAEGAEVVELRLPEAPLVYPAFGTIQRAEALDTHRRAGLFPSRRDEYGADVPARLELATEVTLADYLGASAERQRARAGFARLLDGCDVLLSPVGAGQPFPDAAESGLHL